MMTSKNTNSTHGHKNLRLATLLKAANPVKEANPASPVSPASPASPVSQISPATVVMVATRDTAFLVDLEISMFTQAKLVMAVILVILDTLNLVATRGSRPKGLRSKGLRSKGLNIKDIEEADQLRLQPHKGLLIIRYRISQEDQLDSIINQQGQLCHKDDLMSEDQASVAITIRLLKKSRVTSAT